jgi:quercetin dioxygenase-like cupin family protein
MEQTHGTWGERLRTFEWSGGIVTILFLQPSHECSWHKHIASYNKFTCISGKVVIETDKGYKTELFPKQEFTVEPGVMHKFITVDEYAVVEEIAYCKYNEHDIQREKLGGPVNG